MTIIRSDGLSSLVATENELNNGYGGEFCDPTIEDSQCKDEKITDIILQIIKDNSIQSTLSPGNCISITSDTINLNVGAGLKNDGLNNVAIDYDTILTPKDGTCIDVLDTGVVNLNIGSGLKSDNNNIAIDYGSLPLVTPELLTVVKEYNNTKTTLLRTLTNNNVSVEEGCLVDVDSKFKYRLLGQYSAPTSITGDYSSIIVPDETYSSSLLINDTIFNSSSNNIEKRVNFTRLKSGLNVVNNKVVNPVGNDLTTNKFNVNISYPFYLGFSTSLIPSQIEFNSFTKQLSSKTSSLTFNSVTADVNSYTYFIFPSDVIVNSIIMDGAAPVLGAFTLIPNTPYITITGLTKGMNVLKSNAKGAFNNNSLRFDFHL